VKYIVNSGTADELGGKGYGLAQLQEGGFLVPGWFAVSPRAFEDSLNDRQRRALEGGHIQEIRSALEDVVLSPRVLAELNAALRELSHNGGEYAVRSSALDEDSADCSFAGQLESYLCVPGDVVAERAAAVWRSGFSERVLAYRSGKENPSVPKRAPAVVIQRMIDAQSAGVVFSADPVSGRLGIVVISAVFGLGMALVGGESDADVYEIDRSGKISRTVVATKKIRLCHDAAAPGRVSPCNIPSGEQTARVLTDEQARDIAALSRQISRRMGRAQDIEWAIENGKIYVLQARPITTMRDLPDPDAVRTIWDNSNITESYSGITTPLTFSFARAAYEAVYRELCRILKVPDSKIAANEQILRNMLGLIRGRVYYNLLNWYRMLALLPGFTVNRGFMEQMMGVKEPLPDDVLNRLAAATFRERVRDAWQSARMLAALVWNCFALARKTERFRLRLNRALADPVPCLADMRVDELVKYYHNLLGQILTRWDAPLLNDLFTMIFHGLLRQLSQRWLQGGDELANELVRAQGGMISLEPATRLREMAGIAACNSELVQVLRRGEPAESLRAIRQIPELGQKYDEYLAKFGERCLEELKLESPTLHDDPSLLLRSIGELARGLAIARPPDGEVSRAASAEQRVGKVLRRHPLRRLIFKWVLRNAREGIRSRENLRFERTRVFGRVRRVFVEIGNRLCALDLLEDTRDIFYLQVEEVFGFIQGTAATTNVKQLVALRKREFQEMRGQPRPSDRFETHEPVYQGNQFQSQTNAEKLSDFGEERRGLGSCPGRVRGRVRVITDARAASLPAGSILVAERTDPGWIMLFAAAAGLIVERGSLLSHSAIVSREIGIPSVVSVPGVTEWLRDGDLVEIDGGKGIVRRLRNEEAHA
jgi:phosphohistidine swiveling domain-containing protein